MIRVIPIVLILSVVCPSAIYGDLTEKCADCHTMHDSQDGQSLTGAGPQPDLSNTSDVSTCWGCHAKGTDSNIDPVTGAPQILHTNAIDLAGGNFAYITGNKSGSSGDSMTRGHNVLETGVTDSNFSNGAYPPGDEFGQSGDGFNNTTFTCAGRFGCHGDRSAGDIYGGIRGAHHASRSVLQFGSINEVLQGASVSTSYRYLLGVKGGEDADWEATVSASDHNEYKGAPSGTESTQTSPGGNTISGLCAECHGDFHGDTGDTGGASAWKRHPTDISLPGTGTEYAYYRTYNPSVPVARTAIPDAPAGPVNPAESTDDIVMCLSCHRAHASPYADILRWDYRDMIAGTTGDGAGSGCFVCHTGKDGL